MVPPGTQGREKEKEKEERFALHSNGQHRVPAQCAGENKHFGCAGTHFDHAKSRCAGTTNEPVGAVPAHCTAYHERVDRFGRFSREIPAWICRRLFVAHALEQSSPAYRTSLSLSPFRYLLDLWSCRERPSRASPSHLCSAERAPERRLDGPWHVNSRALDVPAQQAS